MKFIFSQMLMGLFQGFGFELSFLILWLIWKLAHSKIAHRVGKDSWFHHLGDYLN